MTDTVSKPRKHGLSVAERIEYRRVVRGECWEVDIDRGKTYPQINVGGTKVAVHRAYYESVVGQIPTGLIVMHICDNPRCHRPTHLKLGTATDNMKDMAAKGRRRGKQAVTCDPLMAALASVLSQNEIAECYGVSQTVISVALRRAGLARGRGTSFGRG